MRQLQSASHAHIKLRTVLDRAADAIEGKFKNQPQTEASIRATIGETYLQLSNLPAAEQQLKKSLDLRRQTLGEEHPETLKDLALVFRSQGRTSDAESLLRLGLDAARRVHGEEHPSTLALMVTLAYVLQSRYDFAPAEELYLNVIEVPRRVLGESHRDTLGAVQK